MKKPSEKPGEDRLSTDPGGHTDTGVRDAVSRRRCHPQDPAAAHARCLPDGPARCPRVRRGRVGRLSAAMPPRPRGPRWPLRDGACDRLLFTGPGALSDAELLTLIFQRGTRVNARLDRASRLLARFGGLRALSRLVYPDWQRASGSDRASYVLLAVAAEIGRRCLAERLERSVPLESPGAAGDYLRGLLRDRTRELFGCLLLDARHQIIGFEELFHGTIDGSVVHTREVVRCALLKNAAALIAVHNHPSGIAEPSQADIALTHRLRDALELVDVRLLDHLIVGDEVTLSLSERGQMSPSR